MVPKTTSSALLPPPSFAAFARHAIAAKRAGTTNARVRAAGPAKTGSASFEPAASFGELLERVAHRRKRDDDGDDHDDKPPPSSLDDDAPLLTKLNEAAPALQLESPLSGVHVPNPATPPALEAAKSQAARSAEIAALAHLTVDAASFHGDGVRGVARLRFGRDARGGLAGATVTLQHDGEALSLTVEGLDEDAAAALRRRIGASE